MTYRRSHFYEKVIKVKADVAALHIFFLPHRRCCVRWRGELSRAPLLGVHLDPWQVSTPLHNRATNEAKRSSVELRSLVDGFEVLFLLNEQQVPTQSSETSVLQSTRT